MSPWTDTLCQQQQKYEEGWQSVWLQYTVWSAKCKKKWKHYQCPLTIFFLSKFSFIFRLVYSMLRLPAVMFSEWAVTALTIPWICMYSVLQELLKKQHNFVWCQPWLCYETQTIRRKFNTARYQGPIYNFILFVLHMLLLFLHNIDVKM